MQHVLGRNSTGQFTKLGVKSPYSKIGGGEITIMDQDNPSRRRAEQQAIRRDIATKRYGSFLGKGLMDYVSHPCEVTKRDFAALIADGLGNKSRALRTGALMALMSAFELIMEDSNTSLMDATKESRFDSMRIR